MMRIDFQSPASASNLDSAIINTQNAIIPYIVPPVMQISSSSSGSNLKHASSIRKKGRFRVRRVSKTPEGSKDNIKREASCSPVKSVSISSICPNLVAPQSFVKQPVLNHQGKRGVIDVMVYNVSILFSKSYDLNLASQYVLDESGNYH